MTDTIDENNRMVLQMLSNYLNNAPDFIQGDDVNNISKECDVSVDYAYAALLAAACGLDTANRDRDFQLFLQYFVPMIRCCQGNEYTSNPYYKKIHHLLEHSLKHWTLKMDSYQPYEAFVRNDFITMNDGRIIPQIGFFEQKYSYPAIYENQRLWMSVTPNEIDTMKQPVKAAAGRVLTYGLGLGYYAYMVSLKENVSHVTVVERDSSVIQLFQQELLPQFEQKQKIEIIEADAFEFAKSKAAQQKFDYIFTDLWHDVSDGMELYLKMKQMEAKCPKSTFSYWIEKSLRCYMDH